MSNNKQSIFLVLIIICFIIFPEFLTVRSVFCQPTPPKIEGIELLETIISNKNPFNLTKTSSWSYMKSIGITNDIFIETFNKIYENNGNNVRSRMVWLDMKNEFEKHKIIPMYHNHVFLQIWLDNFSYHINCPLTHNYLLNDNFIQWQFRTKLGLENQYLTNNITLSNRPLDLYKEPNLKNKDKLIYLNELRNESEFLKNILKLRYGS